MPIAESTYWTRVWIQQEVAFAAQVRLHCRAAQIHGEHLLRFQHLIREKNLSTRVDLTSQWASLEMHYIDLSGPFRDRPGEHRNKASGYRYSNIVEGLGLCEHLASTDPKDRVFAVLNFSGR